MTKRGGAIVLIGFMGAGKSSVGRRLEVRTGFPRFDTDEIVAAKFDLPIPKIFEIHGEDAFRDTENATLQSFDSSRSAIIVTGGGIVLRARNRELLRQLGIVVYLQADEKTLFARVSRRTSRPLLRTDNPRATMRALLEKRLPLYEQVADLTVETSQLPQDEVCDSILKQLKN
jgi:shikimate kinase